MGHFRTGRLVVEFDHLFQTSEKIHVAIQKMSESDFFWKDKKHVPIRLWQKKLFQSWMKRTNLWKDKFIVLIRKRLIPTKSKFSSWINYLSKIGIVVKIMSKVSMRWKKKDHVKSFNEMEELKRFQWFAFDSMSRKNGQISKYYPWIHKQDSGITE